MINHRSLIKVKERLRQVLSNRTLVTISIGIIFIGSVCLSLVMQPKPSASTVRVSDSYTTLKPVSAVGGPTWPDNPSAYNPTKTIDGNGSTYWAGDPGATAWHLTYDLGAVRYISSVEVQFYPRKIKNVVFVPQSLTVLKSDDGAVFDVVRIVEGADSDLYQIAVGLNARYIRLDLEGLSPAPSKRQPAVQEVRLIGGTAVTPLQSTPINYKSSFDGTPLKARVSYRQKSGKLPVVVVMHGWGGNMDSVQEAESWLQRNGYFALNVAMRGRDGSGGSADAGRLEIHDIYDAVHYVLKNYGEIIDPDRVAIWGFSGGGGNAFSAAVKMPDLFSQVAAFFGMNDYAYWREHGAGEVRSGQVDAWHGGTPSEFPERFQASRSLSGVVNNPWSEIHLFWDEQERTCPEYFNLEWLSQSQALGYINTTAHKSMIGDARRWLHGYPQPGDALEWAMDQELGNRLRYKRVPMGISVPDQGAPTFRVLGFLLTKKFSVYLGDAKSATANISYRYENKSMDLSLSDAISEDSAATAKIIVPLAGRTVKLVEGAVFTIDNSKDQLVLKGVALNGAVRVVFN